MILLLALAPFSGGSFGREVDHSVSSSVVKIRGVDLQQRLFYGSGVVVGEETVATNCHVVRDAVRISVSRGFDLLPVQEEQVDLDRDLCLLKVPKLEMPVARLAPQAKIHRGDQVHFYGYPRALGLSYTYGKVSGLPTINQHKIIETTAFFTLGGSGGGVFDGKGRLLGLATFMRHGHSGGYYLIPADWIIAVRQLPQMKVAPLEGHTFWEKPPAHPISQSHPP
jgi:S1-C subfamily serine protease